MNSTPAHEDRGATRTMSALAGKYLTFALGQEEYGLPVLKVREIIKLMDITQVPQVPGHVRGVINLRGRVIPVIDLRLKLGLPFRENTERTCIIVVDVAFCGPNARALMGIVVDSVSEVLNVAETDMDQAPDFGGHVTTESILGLAKVKGTMKILLNLDEVLGDQAAQPFDALPGAAVRRDGTAGVAGEMTESSARGTPEGARVPGRGSRRNEGDSVCAS